MAHYCFDVNGLSVDAYYRREDVQDVFLPLLRRWSALQRQQQLRILVLLAGAPGSGKSTFSLFLQHLSEQDDSLVNVQALGMDGFHHDNAWLKAHHTARNGTEIPLLAIKGAPETFDTDALLERLQLAGTGNPGWPAYSRIAHAPVDNALTVTGKILLVEGNYFLLDQKPWDAMRDLADDLLYVDVPEEILLKRLVLRKMASGMSEKDAEAFVSYSDGVNVQLVKQHSVPAMTIRFNEDNEVVNV